MGKPKAWAPYKGNKDQDHAKARTYMNLLKQEGATNE